MSARTEFTQYFLDDSYVELTFDNPDGVGGIYDYLEHCRRFAYVLGYDSELIEKIFRLKRYEDETRL